MWAHSLLVFPAKRIILVFLADRHVKILLREAVCSRISTRSVVKVRVAVAVRLLYGGCNVTGMRTEN